MERVMQTAFKEDSFTDNKVSQSPSNVLMTDQNLVSEEKYQI
jgi:hypothetical protein